MATDDANNAKQTQAHERNRGRLGNRGYAEVVEVTVGRSVFNEVISLLNRTGCGPGKRRKRRPARLRCNNKRVRASGTFCDSHMQSRMELGEGDGNGRVRGPVVILEKHVVGASADVSQGQRRRTYATAARCRFEAKPLD